MKHAALATIPKHLVIGSSCYQTGADFLNGISLTAS